MSGDQEAGHGHDEEDRHGHEDENGHDHGEYHDEHDHVRDEHDHDDHDDHDHDDHHHHDDHDDHDDHHHHDVESVGVAVVTVSSSRTLDDDPAGDYIEAALEDAGHEVVVRELIPDDFDRIQTMVNRLANRDDADAVITSGGTGVTPDDVTPEAVRQLFNKELPGFGELFRHLSYEEVGTKTVGSRATAGVVHDSPVFCIPGSESAAKLGVEEIILPEVGHLAGLAGRE